MQCNAIHSMPLTISLSLRPATRVNGINQNKSNFTESELIDCMLTNDALLSFDEWLWSIDVLFSIFFALHLSISSYRPFRAHFNQFSQSMHICATISKLFRIHFFFNWILSPRFFFLFSLSCFMHRALFVHLHRNHVSTHNGQIEKSNRNEKKYRLGNCCFFSLFSQLEPSRTEPIS